MSKPEIFIIGPGIPLEFIVHKEVDAISVIVGQLSKSKTIDLPTFNSYEMSDKRSKIAAILKLRILFPEIRDYEIYRYFRQRAEGGDKKAEEIAVFVGLLLNSNFGKNTKLPF